METIRVGVLGATSLVGDSLLPLLQETYAVVPFSRHTKADPTVDQIAPARIPYWISLIPIWALLDYFEMLSAHGARRVVALSSTSIFTKKTSTDWPSRNLPLALRKPSNALSHGRRAKMPTS